MAQAPRAAHVAQERLHSPELTLNVDEHRAIGPVRNPADDLMPIRRLRDARSVVDPLDATPCEAVPMDEPANGSASSHFGLLVSRVRPARIRRASPPESGTSGALSCLSGQSHTRDRFGPPPYETNDCETPSCCHIPTNRHPARSENATVRGEHKSHP